MFGPGAPAGVPAGPRGDGRRPRAGGRTEFVHLQRGPEPAHARQTRAPATRHGRAAGAPTAAQAEAVLAAVRRHGHGDGMRSADIDGARYSCKLERLVALAVRS